MQQQQVNNLPRLMRLNQIRSLTGLSRSTIYGLMKTGDFPPNVQIGARAVGWIDSEIASWLSGRIGARASRSTT